MFRDSSSQSVLFFFNAQFEAFKVNFKLYTKFSLFFVKLGAWYGERRHITYNEGMGRRGGREVRKGRREGS